MNFYLLIGLLFIGYSYIGAFICALLLGDLWIEKPIVSFLWPLILIYSLFIIMGNIGLCINRLIGVLIYGYQLPEDNEEEENQD